MTVTRGTALYIIARKTRRQPRPQL